MSAIADRRDDSALEGGASPPPGLGAWWSPAPRLDAARRRRSGALQATLPLLAGLLPAAWLVLRALRDDLGANPIETVTHFTGDWTLRFLLLTLAVTPLRRLSAWNSIISYRRLLGLLVFFYGSLHFLTYVALDHFFDWDVIVADVVKRPYVTAGFTGFVCMLPLAITSTRGWVRRLGRRWAQLHALVYVAAIAGVVHYLWLVKADTRAPLAYGAVLAVLLGSRVWWRSKKVLDAGRPRAAG